MSHSTYLNVQNIHFLFENNGSLLHSILNEFVADLDYFRISADFVLSGIRFEQKNATYI